MANVLDYKHPAQRINVLTTTKSISDYHVEVFILNNDVMRAANRNDDNYIYKTKQRQ